MVSNEIRNCGIALGTLMHQVTEEQAALLRIIKTNLVAAADSAEEMEATLPVAGFVPLCGCGKQCSACAAGPNTYVNGR